MVDILRFRVALALALFAVSASGSRAFALNPALDMSQYSHTAWRIRDGFSKGVIRSIAQTPDGYLWLGTEFGLLRFDGVRAVPWQPPPDQPLPSDDIWAVLASRDGALWIGTAKGLARWKDDRITLYPEIGAGIVGRLLEDGENMVWVSASGVPSGRLCAIRDRDVQCHGADGRLGYGVWAMLKDRRGTVWLAVTNGIWRWSPGAPTFFAVRDQESGIQAFAEDQEGELLVTTRRGVRRLVDGRLEPYGIPGAESRVGAKLLLRDRDGALWIGTRSGLVHAHQGRADTFAQADGLSGDDVEALFEDREGNVWVATTNGLDRFRDVVVAAVSEKQGLSNSLVLSVRAGIDGSIWLGTPESLEKWADGRVTSYRARPGRSLGQTGRQTVIKAFPETGIGPILADDRGRILMATTTAFGYVEGDRFVAIDTVAARAPRSMVQDRDGHLWLTDQAVGLLRVSPGGEVGQIPWTSMKRSDFATAMIADPLRRGLWLGFWDGGIAYFENGQMRETYTTADGLGVGRVTNLRPASDGSLWVATAGGLSRVSAGKVTTLTRKNGLPCDSVHWVITDDAGSLWLNTTCGLVRVGRDDIAAWIADARHSVHPAVFDAADGARMQAIPNGYEPYVAKSSDGRLWFVGPNGLHMVDPRRPSRNTLPPPVHVERIVADRTARDVRPGDLRVDLPALTRDLQIDYTALSLVAAEKVRFRYMLEGHDRDWQDVGTRRQAFYNDLRPGHYRFRVTASNNSGVWNETGAYMDFSVAPAYYQTAWFAALSMAALVAFVWGGHRVRLRIVEKHRREITALNQRLMKAQEQERIRIAGELHDGVMQEMLAVTMMLGTAKRRIADNADAKATIDKAQQKLIQAGTDIRQLSHDLHPPLLQEAGLPRAVHAYCEQFSAGANIPVTCEADDSVGDLSRGTALALFRVVQEALGNAAKHAAAKTIAVRLTRSDGAVSLTVSDDGVGLDRTRLASGGGLGLVMMRERATQLDGTFHFESTPGRGTTIRVVVPFR